VTLIRPTRRELLTAIPLVVGASAFARPGFAQPAPTSVNFLVVGDWGRGGSRNQNAVARQMGVEAAARESQFIASTGDNFYMFGVSSERDRQWQTSFLDVYGPPGLLSLPWYPVLGNHDYGGDVLAQVRYRHGDPGRGVGWQMADKYYSRSIPLPWGGTVDLFFIDTVMWIGTETPPFYFIGDRPSPEEQRLQAEWLIEQLDASNARFKFVVGHHGVHSIGPHGGEIQMAQLDDVLQQYGVTAYIHGHDHCLFHISHRGMQHICSGGGSNVKADYSGGPEQGCVYSGFCNREGSNVPFPRWHQFVRDAGFASFNVYPDRVDFKLIDKAGIARHEASLYERPRLVNRRVSNQI
jgi:tartrate-resistant acid phosphatase type 5